MKDITERIDDMCQEIHGHTHWVCVDTMSDIEKVGLDQVADIVTIEGQRVAFYYAEADEDERTYLVYTLDYDSGLVKSEAQWTVAKIIAEINRDRSEAGSSLTYDESNWQEAWLTFMEAEHYAIPEVSKKWVVKLYWENASDAPYGEDLATQEEVFLTTRDETKMHYVHTYFFDTEAEKDAFVMGVNDARRYGQCIIFNPGGELDTIIERDVSKLP